MAISIRSNVGFDAIEGGNNRGGWFKIGGAGVDYSQNTSPILTITDGVTDGTTKLISTTGGWTSAMVDNGMHLDTGGGDYREIVAWVSSNEVTMDATVATDTGITVNVGGAFALPNAAILNLFGNGDTKYYVKSGGTFTFTEIMTSLYSGIYGTAIKEMNGFKTTRGDICTGDDRPLIALGVYALHLYNESSWKMSNLRFTGSTSYVFRGPKWSLIQNVKVTQTSTGDGFYQSSGGFCHFVDCEADGSGSGSDGFYLSTGCNLVKDCYVYDFPGEGFRCAGPGNVVVDSIAGTCGKGITATGDHCSITNTTIYNCDTGLEPGSIMPSILGLIIDSCTVGVAAGTKEVIIDWCNFNNNGTNLTGTGNTILGANCTFIDPDFENPSLALFFPGGLSPIITNTTGSAMRPGGVQGGNGSPSSSGGSVQ